jgi:ATP-dependent DNA ligase
LQAHISNEQIKLYSRNGVESQEVYEDLSAYLKDAIKADACILDGEVIVLDSEDNKMMPFGLNKLAAVNH